MISTTVLPLLFLLPSLVWAKFPAEESYAACVDTQPGNLVEPIATSQLNNGAQGCSLYCSDKKYRYAILSPGSTSCACSNTGPTAAELSTATDASMSCSASQYDVRIALTTFGVPTCYTQFSPASDASLRDPAVTVSDVSQCFRQCLQRDGATVIPSTTDSTYSCICDRNAGEFDDADRTVCARGAFIRYGDHSPGETTEGTAAPGPSTFVKRQMREQMRLASQQQASLCPLDGTACFVGKGMTSWECLEVESDLESCGGCLWGGISNQDGAVIEANGVDCTAIPGVTMGGVTCTHGQCAIWACDPGFKLEGRECVPVGQAWVSR